MSCAFVNWTPELTEPWAILLSGVATLVAALVVAILGPWILSRRFETLDDAANSAQEAVGNVRDRMATLDIQIGALERSLATVQNVLNDFFEDQKAEEEAQPQLEEPAGGAGEAPARREQLRSYWNDVRSRVEDIAANPATDGRTRAKYSRIDRRNFRRLLEAIREDGGLGQNPQPYFEALGIWSRYRANRTVVTEQDLNAMQVLRNQILAVQG